MRYSGKIKTQATYHHSNVISCAIAAFFNSFIDYHIHKGIESTKYSGNGTTSIQFKHHSLVHESDECEKIKFKISTN